MEILSYELRRIAAMTEALTDMVKALNEESYIGEDFVLAVSIDGLNGVSRIQVRGPIGTFNSVKHVVSDDYVFLEHSAVVGDGVRAFYISFPEENNENS